MYEIFEKLLTKHGVKAADVSKATGIRSGVFSDWKMGRYEPKRDKLQKIADYFGVPVDYLTTGVMPTYYLNDETAEIALEIFENRDLRALFDIARKLPPETIRTTATLLENMKGTNPDG